MSTTLSRTERKIKFKSLAFAALQKSTMSTTLSRKERKIKFKSLAFAALQKSTSNETICVQVGAHDGKRWDPVFGHITQNGWNALVIEPHPIFSKD